MFITKHNKYFNKGSIHYIRCNSYNIHIIIKPYILSYLQLLSLISIYLNFIKTIIFEFSMFFISVSLRVFQFQQTGPRVLGHS